MLAFAGRALAEDAPADEPVRWGVGGHAGAALDRGGFAVGASGRVQLSPRWTLGLSAEFSPFFDLLSGTVAPGVINGYASFAWTWVSTPTVSLRSTAHVGTSVLLFEPVGTRQGAAGVFLGLAMLAVSIRASDAWSLELSPEVSLAIPSLTGVPYLYRQYRLIATLVRWL